MEYVKSSTLQGDFNNKIDYGLNAGIGLEVKSYHIQPTYDYGFFRTLKYDDFESNNALRNSVVRLTSGYKI